jgi:hypothetical protein
VVEEEHALLGNRPKGLLSWRGEHGLPGAFVQQAGFQVLLAEDADARRGCCWRAPTARAASC